jgi:DNA ligase 1
MTGPFRPPLFRRQLLALAAACAGGWALSGWVGPARAKSLADVGANVLLAQNAPSNINPALYLISEKLDGVRAVWDGTVLKFRSGRTVNAPAWFLAKLPKVPVDGELWLARGKFDVLSGMVRKAQPVDAEWEQIKYLVFELPGAEGDFEARAARIKLIVRGTNWSQFQGVEQFRLPDQPSLQARLKLVVAEGGEGLMLHRSNAPYLTGRNEALLKLKPISDAEAEVVAHIPGKGKHAGVMGALEVKTDDGHRFRLGTGFTDEQRKSPPAVGSRVTYTYRDLTPSGKPRFAAFLRMATLD